MRIIIWKTNGVELKFRPEWTPDPGWIVNSQQKPQLDPCEPVTENTLIQLYPLHCLLVF